MTKLAWHLLIALGLAATGIRNVHANDKLGILSCDALLARHDACVAMLHGEHRANLQANVVRLRSHWMALTKDPSTSTKLGSACLQISKRPRQTSNAGFCSL
jgi:hypothetical protein